MPASPEQVKQFQTLVKQGVDPIEAKKQVMGAPKKTFADVPHTVAQPKDQATILGQSATPATLSSALSNKGLGDTISAKANPYMTTQPAIVPIKNAPAGFATKKDIGNRPKTMQEISGSKAPLPTISANTKSREQLRDEKTVREGAGEYEARSDDGSMRESSMLDSLAPVKSMGVQLQGSLDQASDSVNRGLTSALRGGAELVGATSVADVAKRMQEKQARDAEESNAMKRATANQQGLSAGTVTDALSGKMNQQQAISTALTAPANYLGAFGKGVASTGEFAGGAIGNTASAVSGLYGGGQQAQETGEMLGGMAQGAKQLATDVYNDPSKIISGAKQGLDYLNNPANLADVAGQIHGGLTTLGGINKALDPINMASKGISTTYQGAKQGAKLLGKAGSAIADVAPGALKATGQALGNVAGKAGQAGMAVLRSPYTLTKRVIDSKPVSNLIKNTAIKETGVEGSTLKRFMEKPELVKAFEEGSVSREGLASMVQSKIDEATNVLNEGNPIRKQIRESGDFVPQATIDKSVQKWARENKIPMGIDETGKPTFDFSKSAIPVSSRKKIEETITDLYNASRDEGGLSADTYLNKRQLLDNKLSYEDASAERALKGLRANLNEGVRDSGHIAGLAQIDDTQSSILKTLQNIADETGVIKRVDGRWQITDTSESKLANLLKTNNRRKLEALEQYIPGITQHIEDLSAIEDLGRVMTSHKVGTYQSNLTSRAGGAAIGGLLGSVVPGFGTATGAMAGAWAGGMVSPLTKIKLITKLLGSGKSADEVAGLLKNPGKLAQVLEESQSNLAKAGSELPLGGTKRAEPVKPKQPLYNASSELPTPTNAGEMPQGEVPNYGKMEDLKADVERLKQELYKKKGKKYVAPKEEPLKVSQAQKMADTPGAIRTKEDLSQVLKSDISEADKIRVAKDFDASQKAIGIDPDTGAPLKPISGERQTILRPKNKVTQATQAPSEVKALGSPAMNARYYKGIDLSDESAISKRKWQLGPSAQETAMLDKAITNYKRLSQQEEAKRVMGAMATALPPKLKQQAVRILSEGIVDTQAGLKAELKNYMKGQALKGKEYLKAQKLLNAPKTEAQLISKLESLHGIKTEEATNWLHDNISDLVKMPEKELIDELGLTKEGILKIQKEMWEGKSTARAEKMRVTKAENKIRAEAKAKGVEQPLSKVEQPLKKAEPKAKEKTNMLTSYNKEPGYNAGEAKESSIPLTKKPMKEAKQPLTTKVSKEQADNSLEWYRGSGYENVNKQLRTGKKVDNPSTMKEDYGFFEDSDQTIKHLDSIMTDDVGSKYPVLHRGIRKSEEDMGWYNQMKNLKAGDTFEEKGFMSTAKGGARAGQKSDEYALNAYSLDKSKDNLLMEIEMPKGFKGHDVRSTVDPEVILPRGTKFEVVSRETRRIGKTDVDVMKVRPITNQPLK